MADGIICKYDEYFDPFTGNCDPCKPICDVTDCTQLCPNYSTITTATSTDIPAGEYNTNIILIIFLVLLCISVVTTMIFVLYKRYRQTECICIRHQYKTRDDIKQPIQATDDLLVTITLINE